MRTKVVLVLLPAVILAVLVLLHTPGLNGPSYWVWRWRDPLTPAFRWYVAMLLCAAPALLVLVIPSLGATRLSSPNSAASRRDTLIAIALLMISTFALRVASAVVVRGWFDVSLITEIIKSPGATSYYGDAGFFSTYEHWLRDYPDNLYSTTLHTQSKPPGPMLYWMTVIRVFSYGDHATVIGAFILAALATLSIPASYWMIRTLTGRSRAALFGAAWVALAPGFVLFFPMFDPVYLIFSCTIVTLWHLAIKRQSYPLSALFGLVVAVAMFWTYLVAVLTPFLLFEGLLCTGNRFRNAVGNTLKHALVALVMFSGFYIALYAATEFNPVATFDRAWTNQGLFLQRHVAARVYPTTVPFDLLDFLLGAGWISLPLVLFAFTPSSGTPGEGWGGGPGRRALLLLCIALPIFVALTGLVQAETARVWMFMLPLWVLPVGLELERWPRWAVVAVYVLLWLLTAAIGHNMLLINPAV